MSKKSFTLIVSIAILLCAFLNVSAQERTFTIEELTALKKAAEEKLKGKTYRRTSNTVYYADGSDVPYRKSKSIVEIIPPDRYRSLTVTETAGGVKRYETIHVGARSFSREDDGEWKELTRTGSGSGGGIGDGGLIPKVEKTIERKLKKGVVAGSQTVDLYETFSNYKFIYPTVTITKIWRESYSFDAAGRFVKYEEDYQESAINSAQESLNNSARKSVEEYEYDPKIKIEVPVLKKETK